VKKKAKANEKARKEIKKQNKKIERANEALKKANEKHAKQIEKANKILRKETEKKKNEVEKKNNKKVSKATQSHAKLQVIEKIKTGQSHAELAVIKEVEETQLLNLKNNESDIERQLAVELEATTFETNEKPKRSAGRPARFN
jgi:hypothetical protein